MAREIIAQERTDYTNYFTVKAVFWLAVPVAKQPFFANATATSTVTDASGSELTALQNGSVFEESGTFSYPTGTAVATIGADLVTRYNAAQTALNATDKYQFYGSSYDGTSWTVKGA